MESGKQVMMAVPENAFGDQVHMTLLRQMVDGMAEINRQLHTMNEYHLKTAERLGKLEATPVAELAARVKVLEEAHIAEKGGWAMLKTIKEWAPFVAIVLAAAIFYFVQKAPAK
jgi:hypothetical protein